MALVEMRIDWFPFSLTDLFCFLLARDASPCRSSRTGFLDKERTASQTNKARSRKTDTHNPTRIIGLRSAEGVTPEGSGRLDSDSFAWLMAYCHEEYPPLMIPISPNKRSGKMVCLFACFFGNPKALNIA